MEWITEKEAESMSGMSRQTACCFVNLFCYPIVKLLFLRVDDFGHDKDSVMVLLRKHQTLERDLAVLGSKLEQVFSEVGIGMTLTWIST
jgi:hypothetical protein